MSTSSIEWTDKTWHAKTAASRLGMSVDDYLMRRASGEKWCTRCSDWHPCAAFGIDRSRGDGLAARCRQSGYVQRGPHSPSRRERKAQASMGLRWCSGCHVWMAAASVSRGKCRTHRNEQYRRYYADKGRAAISQRVHARKRRTEPLPVEAQVILTELFAGRCAYCAKPATTWDHIAPVSRGGRTVPGNIVPACVSCNSSKRDKDVFNFLDGRFVSADLEDAIALAAYKGLI